VRVKPSTLDRLLKPLHRWIWADAGRRARKLLTFAETEADGGRDLARAAELPRDPLLRRLYLLHAQDEQRHADLFARRGRELVALHGAAPLVEANWLAPGERGLDDVRVEQHKDEALLAFLHLSESAAAGRFAAYAEVLEADARTREVFSRILKDEVFHMTYTRRQLARLAPRDQGVRLWQARAGRMFSAYLRIAVALASLFGQALLTLQYFVLLPPFAALARRSTRRETQGFVPARAPTSMTSQY